MKYLDGGDILANEKEPNRSKWFVLRQVGWLGGTGRFYTMEDNPTDDLPGKRRERGSISPIYIQIEPE